MIGILGGGPHGREISTFLPDAVIFDDNLDWHRPVVDCDLPYVIGAAWPHVRRQIAAKVTRLPRRGGTIVFPGARVSPAATLGVHTHVGYNAVISHGCHVRDFVTICAGVVLGGDVTVEDDVFVGINASVIHGGITIGQGALIGAGAVVTKDVRPGVTMVGCPARETAKARPWFG